ncbi:hypothetical protein ACNOYE_14885 [Nannocystaceae bacterium ST9]
MRTRVLALPIALALASQLGCLRAFGPDLRTREQHAGLESVATRDECMACHVSEPEAIALGVDEAHPAPAPIVAGWMIDERRECVVCHHVHVPRADVVASRLERLGPGVADAR